MSTATGEADEHRHHEEHDGDHGADGLDRGGVGVHARVAREARAVLNVPRGVRQVLDLGARVGDLGEGIGALGLEGRAGVVELGLAVCDLGEGVVELALRVGQLLEGVGALAVELGPRSLCSSVACAETS